MAHEGENPKDLAAIMRNDVAIRPYAARRTGLRVLCAPHRRYRPGDYETWKYLAPIQKAAWSRKTFEDETWGGERGTEFLPRRGDIVSEDPP